MKYSVNVDSVKLHSDRCSFKCVRDIKSTLVIMQIDKHSSLLIDLKNFEIMTPASSVIVTATVT